MYYFKIAFKKSFVYRSSVFFSIIGSTIWIFISIYLWIYVYHNEPQKVEYMITYVILSNIISMFYSNTISSEIGQKVIDGSFALDLIKPANFILLNYSKMLGEMCATICLKGLPIVVIFCPLIVKNLKLSSWNNLLLAFVVVILGHLLNTIFYSLIGFSAFIITEIWPLNRLMNDTIRFISGAIIPISFFPHKIYSIIRIMPFHYLYSFPLQLILNKEYNNLELDLAILVAWVIGSGILLLFVYRKAITKCTVQGG